MGQVSSISRTGKTEPFELQVARGQITGHSVRNIFGTATAIGTTLTTPWELANTNALPLLSAPQTISIVSSAAGDTTQSILISGCGPDYVLTSEVVQLNGTTPVTTTNTYRAINDLVTTSGNCAGNVTASYDGTVYAQITAGRGRNQAAVFTVPAGYAFYLMRIDAFSATSTGASKYITFRNKNTFSDGRVFNVAQTTFALNMQILRQMPFEVPEKTTLEFQAAANSTTAEVGIFGEGILIKTDGPL